MSIRLNLVEIFDPSNFPENFTVGHCINSNDLEENDVELLCLQEPELWKTKSSSTVTGSVTPPWYHLVEL
jgi:hypothetical protein